MIAIFGQYMPAGENGGRSSMWQVKAKRKTLLAIDSIVERASIAVMVSRKYDRRVAQESERPAI